ncbi:phage portal protein [Rossellomorea aquimaris]|uniref:phage portal protein n=1 Tax=Rossellomorea TaxID=2837508 RepID=UPI0016539231|nr:phage portal protein [Rossellomorea vietnamensis]
MKLFNGNLKIIQQFIKDRIQSEVTRVSHQRKMKKYYDGEHDIQNKEANGNSPSNKLTFNFPELIVDFNHAYLFSNSVTYSPNVKNDAKTDLFLEKMKEVFDANNEEKVTNSLGKTSSIFGEAVEVHYIDSEGRHRFQESNPLEWVFFEINGEEMALRYYETVKFEVKNNSYEEVAVNKYTVYTMEAIYQYEEIDDKLSLLNEIPHFFGEVPVVRYMNKSTFGSEGVSDLKNVISLVDAYNKTTSALLDTIENNSDPYLLLINLGVRKEEVDEMRKRRILQFKSQEGMNSEAKYLTYEGDLSYIEDFLNRLVRKIALLSFTPDVISKDTGKLNGDSGEALKMKVATSSDIKANGKVMIFREGLRKRIRLIARQLQNASNLNFYNEGTHNKIDSTFNKNLPTNTKEIIEMMKDAVGILSHETMLKQIPFVEDVEEEMERIQKEQGEPIQFEEEPGDE